MWGYSPPFFGNVTRCTDTLARSSFLVIINQLYYTSYPLQYMHSTTKRRPENRQTQNVVADMRRAIPGEPRADADVTDVQP